MRSVPLALVLLVACGEDPIEPGSETVETSWDVDLFSAYEGPVIARFDPQEGRRRLDGMTIAVDHTAELTTALENTSATAVTAEDYTFELYFQTIIQLGLVDDGIGDPDDSPPFFGPGSFVSSYAVDLGATDGDPLGGDDQHARTETDHVVFEADYDRVDTEAYLDAMTGPGDLTLVVGGFSEAWMYWDDDFTGDVVVNAGATAIQYSGTMTVTYDYSPAE